MISRVRVQGFKSLLDVDVELGRLTVFVGANGSGKTSVLEAIDYVAQMAAQGYSLPFSRLVSRQRPEEIRISLDLNEDGLRRGVIGSFNKDGVEMETPGFEVEDERQRSRVLFEVASRIGLYRLDASEMAKATYSQETKPRLDFSGGNLAAVLDFLQGEARESFDAIEAQLVDFVPYLRRLRVKRAKTAYGGADIVGHQVAFDFENANDIGAPEASEGTLLLLGLLTIVQSQLGKGAFTIMLDDLDRALHPKAQRSLVGYLHKLIQDRPEIQILATTHSPYLVEHLDFDEVRAITLAADGSSVIGSLADHPEAERWREEMSAGEFWSAVGENWLAATRKSG